MVRVVSVQPFPDFSVEIRFADGLTKRVDLRPFIADGLSRPLGNWEFFRQVAVDSAGGIYWPNGYDFCPVFLRDYAEGLEREAQGLSEKMG